MRKYILALDLGTTGNRAVIYDRRQRVVAKAYQEFKQYYPKPGWVEHDPLEIWRSAHKVIKKALIEAKLTASDIAGLGISNQRETIVAWDAETGKPVHHAIVWQCRRTTEICEQLKADGYEQMFRERTGLLIDAYFSGTKIKWLLNNLPAARSLAQRGQLRVGTIESWLVWQLTLGKAHVADVSNASRTLLFNIKTMSWDSQLLEILDIPASVLPLVVETAGQVGVVDESLFGNEMPITALVGDQQAALFGQQCWHTGEAKATYGTGGFVMVNLGNKLKLPKEKLLATVAWSINGQTAYALEGSIFVCGAAIQWLRDELKIIKKASEIDRWANSLKNNEGVYFVPALTGLGAPHWQMEARGTIVGLTRGSGRAHLARATLEALAYQTDDVLKIMTKTLRRPLKHLKVDGGVTNSDWLMQFQAGISKLQLQRSANAEATALGAAYLAGLGAGFWTKAQLKPTGKAKIFKSKMRASERQQLTNGWQKAVLKTKET